jgi:hypothetical protein
VIYEYATVQLSREGMSEDKDKEQNKSRLSRSLQVQPSGVRIRGFFPCKMQLFSYKTREALRLSLVCLAESTPRMEYKLTAESPNSTTNLS